MWIVLQIDGLKLALFAYQIGQLFLVQNDVFTSAFTADVLSIVYLTQGASLNGRISNLKGAIHEIYT